jgi:mRNA interferase MazF
MVIKRGDIWWADLPAPSGSGPGYRRPVIIIQADKFNRSAINTVIIAVITKNLRFVNSLGNVLLTANQSGLPKDSVVNVSQLYTMDESLLLEYVSAVSDKKMEQINEGLRQVLSL